MSDPSAAASRQPNRLIHERSPYLRQHAYNPVDWYPWGEPAFAAARQQDKPVFLSIGYSTCHWCHVMERESFEDPATAALLNQWFVSIKVDREERPDLDKIYMTAVQAVTGAGGWPMSVWLNHQLEPFFCGTYFPPESRWGRPGFREILERIHQVWEANPDGLRAQAEQIAASLREHLHLGAAPAGAPDLDAAPLALGVDQFRATYDADHGGFGSAPKFPRPVVLQFLLRRAARGRDRDARAMADHTLRAMGQGGLFDHLGGGFHRYSVDARWLVSHFEKMLYDQAQLLAAYSEAFQLTRDPFHADIARRTAAYVLRDLLSPDGAFYAAEDADSEGVEGKFYVWTRTEIEQALQPEDSSSPPPPAPLAPDLFCRVYGIEPGGNWEHGQNVLHRALDDEQAAKLFRRPIGEIAARLADARARLLAVRDQRVRPHRDDKIITAWNGMMIAGLAKAAAAGIEPDPFAAAAVRAARYLLAEHRRDGRLWRTPTVPAVLDDYAWLATGLVDLYHATFDPEWLGHAVALADEMLERFLDREHGGFFMTTGQDPTVILRAKEDQDGAEPSGNSVAALLLLRLAACTGRDQYRQAAHGTLRLFDDHLRRWPQAVPLLACALDCYLAPPLQVVIAGPPSDPAAQALHRVIQERFRPGLTTLWADGGPWQQQLAAWLPHLRDLRPVNGQPAAYLCEHTACRPPVTSPDQLAKLLD